MPPSLLRGSARLKTLTFRSGPFVSPNLDTAAREPRNFFAHAIWGTMDGIGHGKCSANGAYVPRAGAHESLFWRSISWNPPRGLASPFLWKTKAGCADPKGLSSRGLDFASVYIDFESRLMSFNVDQWPRKFAENADKSEKRGSVDLRRSTGEVAYGASEDDIVRRGTTTSSSVGATSEPTDQSVNIVIATLDIAYHPLREGRQCQTIFSSLRGE